MKDSGTQTGRCSGRLYLQIMALIYKIKQIYFGILTLLALTAANAHANVCK